MALFENMFGTRPDRRGEYKPKAFNPKPFRKPGRLERNDPAAMRAYEAEKQAYEEDMRASIADTEKLLGKEWRKRAFEKSKAEEPARARQALDERAAVNRNIRPADAPLPPEPEKDVKGEEMIDLPEGGKASADTIRMLYKKKGERQTEKEAKETAFGQNIAQRYADAYEANKRRYEEELASRGFTPPKTREEENEYNRLRMEDFRLARQAREKQEVEERIAVKAYRDYKAAAREARKNKDFQAAAGFDAKAEYENLNAGGTLENATARRKHFQDIGLLKLKQELEGRAADRKAIKMTQTGANEASVTPTDSAPPPTPKPTPSAPITPDTPSEDFIEPTPTSQIRPPAPTQVSPEAQEEIDEIIKSFEPELQDAINLIIPFSGQISRPALKAQRKMIEDKIADIEKAMKRRTNAMPKSEGKKQITFLKSILK